jgi:pimeloyl-ACP methyl ester carboxylesterase
MPAIVHGTISGMADELYVERDGAGEPTLLLLHGLGATGQVWDGLRAELAWPGTVVVPDLPGHGRSARLARYSFGSMAAVVATAVEPGRPVTVLGHSLGGVLGLALASGWFGVPVTTAYGLGIKVDWTEPELAKAAEVAARPERVFATRDEAVERWLRVAGLSGLVAADSTLADAAVGATAEGWVVRVDNAAFGVGAPDLDGLLAVSRAAVVLAAGEGDPMSPPERLAELAAGFASEARQLPGLGHNAHVEDPRAVAGLLS